MPCNDDDSKLGAVPIIVKLYPAFKPFYFNSLALRVHEMKENNPHFGFLGSYLSCLLSLGNQAYVGLFGRKRRLSLGVVGVTSAALGGLSRAYWVQTIQLGR